MDQKYYWAVPFSKKMPFFLKKINFFGKKYNVHFLFLSSRATITAFYANSSVLRIFHPFLTRACLSVYPYFQPNPNSDWFFCEAWWMSKFDDFMWPGSYLASSTELTPPPCSLFPGIESGEEDDFELEFPTFARTLNFCCDFASTTTNWRGSVVGDYKSAKFRHKLWTHLLCP